MKQQGSGALVTLDAADRAGIAPLREALVTGYSATTDAR
jgi:hypothetical protein